MCPEDEGFGLKRAEWVVLVVATVVIIVVMVILCVEYASAMSWWFTELTP